MNIPGKILRHARDDRVLVVEDIERRRSVVGIDDRLHAVADIVDRFAGEVVMRRVRIAVRRSESVDDPGEAAIVAHHDVRILIEGQERRQRRHAIAHVAPHQQPAVRRHVVAEGQLCQVAAIECQQDPAQKSAHHNSASALVRGKVVRLALGIVELLLAGLHVHVGVGHLAEIDLRPRHVEPRHRALHRHVREQQRRQALRREPVHRIHRDAVAVRVNQLVVDPVAAALGELVHIQFAHRQHHLAQRAVNLVAVNVDVGKIVVGANLLHLAQRILAAPATSHRRIFWSVAWLFAGSAAPGVVSAGNSCCANRSSP